nr:MAG TPA_asm: hypothetical protein [Bacteriophage sp.]
MNINTFYPTIIQGAILFSKNLGLYGCQLSMKKHVCT